MPHELTANEKKIVVLKCCLFLLYTTTNHFLIRLWRATEVDYLYDYQRQPAQWLDQEEASKHLPKPNLHQKWSWSLFGGVLVVWSFQILAKSLHLRSMLSKLMRCTENCNTCSWHWSIETAQFFTTTPDCTSHNQYFKSWTDWAAKFCLIHHIHLTSW